MRTEIDTSKRRILFIVGVIVVIAVITALGILRVRIQKKNRAQQQEKEMADYHMAPESLINPPDSTKRLPTGSYYRVLTDTAMLEIQKGGVTYQVAPDGSVYLVEKDGSLTRVTNPTVISEVLADALLAAKVDPLVSAIFRPDVLLEHINIEELPEDTIKAIAKAYGLNEDELLEWARKRAKMYLSEYLYTVEDVDISKLSAENLTAFGKEFIDTPFDTFKKYLVAQKVWLSGILGELDKDVELTALTNAELTRLAELLGIDAARLLQLVHEQSLANYIEENAPDIKPTNEEKELTQEEKELKALASYMRLNGITDMTPEELREQILASGQTVEDYLRQHVNIVAPDGTTLNSKLEDKSKYEEGKSNMLVGYKPKSEEKKNAENPIQAKDMLTTDQANQLIQNAQRETTLDKMLELSQSGDADFRANLSDAQVQNGQYDKQDFLASKQTGTKVESFGKKDNMLTVGTLISGTLVTGVNTDLPGQLIARVNTPVYDSFTFTNLIIPKGTLIVGTYDSKVSYAQDRILVAWEKIVMPNGAVIAINGAQGVDSLGYAGMTGNYDGHVWGIIGASVLSAALNIGATALNTSSDVQTITNLLQGSTDAMRQVASKYLDKAINRQPTITVDPGTVIKIMINETAEFPVYAKRK